MAITQMLIEQAVEPLKQLATATAAVAGVDSLNSTLPNTPTLPVQIAAVLGYLNDLSGVPDYPAVAATRTNMRNEALRLRANLTDQRMVAAEQNLASQQVVNDAQEALLREVITNQGTQSARLDELAARLDLVKAVGQNLALDLAANQAHDTAQDARLTAEESLSASQALDIAALKIQNASDAARLSALEAAAQLNATQDAATQATAAQASANAAQARADQAETDAQAAKVLAKAAQDKADADAIAAANAQTTATAAQQAAATNATALAAVQTALAGKLDAALVRRGSVTLPLVTIAVATPATVQVTFATPFPDNNYEVFLSKPGAGLLGVELGWQNKTAAGFTLTERNTGLASLAVPASTADYFAIRN